jgi:hypothetical protein
MRRGLKHVAAGLLDYERAHGALPYSASGQIEALHKIRNHLGQNELSALSSGELLYLNEPEAHSTSAQIILVRETPNGGYYVATGDGSVSFVSIPAPADALIGCWLTIERFVVLHQDVFDEWRNTHPPGGPVRLTSVDGDSTLSYTVFRDGSRIDYSYSSGVLSQCTVTMKSGITIIESVETDQYGRIVGISRSVK